MLKWSSLSPVQRRYRKTKPLSPLEVSSVANVYQLHLFTDFVFITFNR